MGEISCKSIFSLTCPFLASSPPSFSAISALPCTRTIPLAIFPSKHGPRFYLYNMKNQKETSH